MKNNSHEWTQQAIELSQQATSQAINDIHVIIGEPEKHLATIIKAGLIRANMQVTDLANQIDVPRKEIYRWLKENRVAKSEELLKIIKVLKIAPIFFPEFQTKVFQREMIVAFIAVFEQEKDQKKFKLPPK